MVLELHHNISRVFLFMDLQRRHQDMGLDCIRALALNGWWFYSYGSEGVERKELLYIGITLQHT